MMSTLLTPLISASRAAMTRPLKVQYPKFKRRVVKTLRYRAGQAPLVENVAGRFPQAGHKGR